MTNKIGGMLKYSYDEYYEMGLKMVKDDAEVDEDKKNPEEN